MIQPIAFVFSDDGRPVADLQARIEQLEQTMATLESQRALLGDAVVENALAALRQQIATLKTQIGAAPNEERRIVTILFADIVGSTSLAEKLDPEDWRQIVASIHTMAGLVIQRYDGTVVQYLGDGLLAMFGAQTSSEHDPENAIRAALAIQADSLHARYKIQMRIGIHTGMIVVGEMGSSAKREFTGTGDAMNLAARLQAVAAPGSILISHDTYRYVRGIFEATPQPLLTLKGKSEPIQTYLVHHVQVRRFQTTTRGINGIRTRTIGRDTEIQQLQSAFARAMQEHQAIWVQLVGEPGMGKTRLLQTVMEQLCPRDALVFRGRAFQGDERQPFALVRRLWFDRFQIAEDAPLADAEAQWMEQFLALYGPGYEESAHALGLLVGLPFHTSPHIGALRDDPVQLKGRAFVVSRELLAKIRRNTPVVVLFEDLHWADPSSWEYVLHWASPDSIQANGLLVLGTTRPEWNPPPTLVSNRAYTQINLTALSKTAARELAIALMQRVEGVTPDVIEMIVERSEGVPYFAEEIINWFLDRGIINAQREPWQFDHARLKEWTLPATLQHLLLTRLGSLRESERRVLQCGAVFGRNFWEGGLAALGAPASNALLAELQPRHFVIRQPESSFAGEIEWGFHHNLLREVTYESVLKRERPALHRAAAQWLETQARQANRLDEFVATLAEHAERAGDVRQAAEWYIRAGDHARSRSAMVEALRFFERALELLPADDLQQRWYAALRRSDLIGRRGNSQAHRESVAQLLELAGKLGDAQLAAAHYRLGIIFDHEANFLPAVQEYDIGLEAAWRASDHALGTLILGAKVICLGRLGDIQAAQATADQILMRAYEVDEKTSVQVLSNLAVYYIESGDLAKAAQFHSEQVELGHRLGDRYAEGHALNNLGYAFVCLGMFQAGQRALEQSLEMYRPIGVRRDAVYAGLNLGLAHWRMGNNQVALELLEKMERETIALNDLFGRAAGLAYVGLVQETANHLTRARECFRQAAELYEKIGVRSYAMDAYAGLARIALTEGKLAEARTGAMKVWDFLQQNGAQGMEFPVRAYLTCADVFEAAGEAEIARAAVEEGYRELNQRANKISNVQWRQSFLDNVPEHRQIVQKSKLFAALPASNLNTKE